MNKHDNRRSLYCCTAIAAAASMLANCGGGGGGGGSGSDLSPVSLAQERDFSGAIGPINAAVAHDRGYTGEGIVVHLIDMNVFADDNMLRTGVAKQFAAEGSAIEEVKRTKADRKCNETWSRCIDQHMENDTVQAQLIAEPMNGRDGLGVAFDAEVWAYRGNNSGSIRHAAERSAADIIQLPRGGGIVGAGQTEAWLEAMHFAQDQDDLLTIPQYSQKIGSQPEQHVFDFYEEIIGNIVFVGSIDQQNSIASGAAGSLREHSIVAPNDYKAMMWDREGYLTKITYCQN